MVFKVEKLPALEEVLYFILQHQRIVGIKNAVYLNIVLLQASIFQQSPIILFQQTKQLARANFDHSVKYPAISVFSIFFGPHQSCQAGLRLICNIGFFTIVCLLSLQDKPLHHNVVEGVILTNRSLVLQGIDRTRSGDFTCQATNAVGSGQSQIIELDVKCENYLLFAVFIKKSYRAGAIAIFCQDDAIKRAISQE